MIGLTDKEGVTVWMHPFNAKEKLDKQVEDNNYNGLFNKYIVGCDPISEDSEIISTPRYLFDVEKIDKQIVVVESRLRASLDVNRITLQEYNELTNG